MTPAFPAAPFPAASGRDAWPAALLLRGEARTERLGAALAARALPGDTILLAGPVGAGKSALARALIRARLGDPSAEVPSPSFTLVQTYGDQEAIWHVDLHRLSHPSDVLELGLAEALGTALCLIEWPDRLGPLAPRDALTVTLASIADGAARIATLDGPAPWPARLEGLRA